MKISKSLGLFITLSTVQALKCKRMHIGCQASYSYDPALKTDCNEPLQNYIAFVEGIRKSDKCNGADGFSDYITKKAVINHNPDNPANSKCIISLEFKAWRVHKGDKGDTQGNNIYINSCQDVYYSNRICGAYSPNNLPRTGDQDPQINTFAVITTNGDVHCGHR